MMKQLYGIVCVHKIRILWFKRENLPEYWDSGVHEMCSLPSSLQEKACNVWLTLRRRGIFALNTAVIPRGSELTAVNFIFN